MLSITTKKLAFTVVCIIVVETCAGETTKSNQDEMEKLVSEMMQSIPRNDSDVLIKANKDLVPNLGYEPYWYNTYDREWEDRCSHCAKLFQRYTEVCAIDDTGDVVVNISMCGVMRQNCLKGLYHGTSRGKPEVDYKKKVVVAEGWARLSIKQGRECVILLGSSYNNSPPYYEVLLDIRDQMRSELWRSGAYWASAVYTNWQHGYFSRPLGTKDYEEFVIKWNSTSGEILITKTAYSNWWWGFYLMYTDPEPFAIKFMSVSGYDGYNGSYILKDFTIANVGPCGETASGVPRPLPTSPTHVPWIKAAHSVYNWGYYTRLATAGLDNDKQYFSTREEY